MTKAQPSAFVTHIHEELADIGPVDIGRFFGGWAYLVADRQFAISIKDRLYFRVDQPLRDALLSEGCQPFTYNKGGKPVVVHRYYEAPVTCLDDRQALLHWSARAIAAEDEAPRRVRR
ncbi:MULTISPECIES: TfoX/Sxy family protein [Ensifer]|jgi:DNA transformation protein|uniref:TfoX domain containing protein n=1 Tax=Ensifer canadensis TaxID=555315 RepID=A0AAW4FJN8_9HYPH|nr:MULTISPECIES: TfoX/Sxy family protein [Ensifer]KQU73941.1 hypothetical protein ASD00_11195 [Ensifer sp. Root31]KQY78370.1 hypothetical protein ASD52_00420 [Ensifer sp. Root142]MBD9488331.1 TfoX/Sxy family protein [Ensifer sp. ENS11]MBM3092318.1 TfoX domain containing protein [Ensifer canadensis]NOV16370.1 TfoX family protein [Ensifer canadensis]